MFIKTIYQKIFCPYKASKHRAEYEKIARENNLTPGHVYKIAHGKNIKSLNEEFAFNDLVHCGIIKNSWDM